MNSFGLWSVLLAGFACAARQNIFPLVFQELFPPTPPGFEANRIPKGGIVVAVGSRRKKQQIHSRNVNY